MENVIEKEPPGVVVVPPYGSIVVLDAANVPLSNVPASLVAVWEVFPLFTHFTTVPALIVGVAGEKAKSVMLIVATAAPDGGGLLLLPGDVGPELPPHAAAMIADAIPTRMRMLVPS